jgi:20S proteasome alpha/beta subunit
MTVPADAKLQLLGSTMGLIMDSLASHTPGELTADDILDFFAIGMAAVIDNDTHLTTPRDVRIASETAGKRVEQWTKELRKLQVEAGESFLSLAMKVPRTDPPLNS